MLKLNYNEIIDILYVLKSLESITISVIGAPSVLMLILIVLPSLSIQE